MKKVFLPILMLAIFISTGFSQSDARKPIDLVQDAKKISSTFKSIDLLQLDAQTKREALKIEEDITEYSLFDVNWNQLNSIQKDQPATISLSLPVNFTNSIELELVKVDIFTGDFKVTRGYDDSELNVDIGVHYRGIVKGDERSIAAISILDGEVMGLISNDEGNIVLGRVQDASANGKHIAYNDLNVFTRNEFLCAMPDDGIGYKRKDLEWKGNGRAVGDCIRLYMEADYDIFQDKGSGTAAWVTGLMNEVITLYANENISSVVSQIVVWDTPSPYSSTSSSGMLSDFQNNLGSFNGDLGQLLSYQASGGIAAGFSGICNSNSDNSLSFSNVQSTYSNVPTYSWSVMVVTHEFGHLWGSRHTHACVWNGNNTAIDGCSGQTEGSCGLPGFPSQGGTIMSYCHLQSVGINFNEGFGPQPGNVIRNSVANASCTAPCGPPTCTDNIQNGNETGVDCGGPDCPVCPTCSDGVQNGNEEGVDCGGPDCAPCPCNGPSVTLTITLDNYPEETSWIVRNSGGTTVASGGTYGSQPDGSTVVENICLPADGCYDFVISDSYGDGICCAYGSGSYTLTDDSDGSTLASGGSFGSSETTNFCVSGGGGPVTCDIPTGLGATPAETEASLTWSPAAGAVDYNVRARAVGTSTWSTGNNLSIPVNYTNLTACTDYEFQVQSNCSGTTSGWSSSFTFTTTGCVITCDVPSGLGASPTETDASLTWNAAAGALDYNVRARQVGTSTWTTGNNLSSPTSYTGLAACTDYEFQVQSNCDGATSGWSSSFTFTTTGCTGGCTYVTINSNNFDNTWGIWNDGGSDCRRSANDAAYANGGTGRPVRLRDNTSTSVMTTDNLDLTSYSELTVDFNFLPRLMENGEDFWLQVSTNGGSSYTTVATWVAGADFSNNTREFESVVITGTFSSTTRLRFRCDASANSDYIYIDDVVISGCQSSGALIQPDVPVSELQIAKEEVVAPNELQLFPNPVQDQLTVRFNVPAMEDVILQVTDLQGRTMSQEQFRAVQGRLETKVDVYSYPAGIYFMHMMTPSGKITKKFMVNK